MKRSVFFMSLLLAGTLSAQTLDVVQGNIKATIILDTNTAIVTYSILWFKKPVMTGAAAAVGNTARRNPYCAISRETDFNPQNQRNGVISVMIKNLNLSRLKASR